jgi:hypothetical protein
MRSGDPCDRCPDGRMLTYKTRRCPGKPLAVRYLKCDSCGATDAQAVLVADLQPRRKKPASVPAMVNGSDSNEPKSETM